MTNEQNSAEARRLNTKILVIGGVLIGAGGLMGLAGVTLSGSILLTAGRRWIRQMDPPPREAAKHKWVQAKSATAAGVSAWQHNGASAQHARRS